MPHSGRLFRNKLIAVIFQFVHILEKIKLGWQDWDCFAPSFFWMRRPPSHRRGFEAPQSQQLWASLLHKQVTAHCGIFWVRWPSVQTPDGRTTTAAVFLPFDAFFFSRSLSPTQSRWVPCSARLENFVIRELLKCVAWVQSAVAHTHTAQEPVLYFITSLLYSPILFSCNLWL